MYGRVDTTKGSLIGGKGSGLWGGVGEWVGSRERGTIQEKHAMGNWHHLGLLLQERKDGDC